MIGGKSSLSFSLSPQSICWKKMSQTPLKVIGLDHHYTFYSMSWGCLGHFCWKIHLFEKIHFIQCSRTKQQSSEPATPPAGAFPSLCCRYIPSSGYAARSKWNIEKPQKQGYFWKKVINKTGILFSLIHSPYFSALLSPLPFYSFLPGFSESSLIMLHASLLFARRPDLRSSQIFLNLSGVQSQEPWL